MTPTLRMARPDDAEPLARLVVDGIGGYRSFAPRGWEPPRLAEELLVLERLLADPDAWIRLAEAGGEVVGQVTFLAAARSAVPVGDPHLAHLRNLFVRPDHWGTGLAGRLHDEAIAEAERRGFDRMRLFTPTEHGRARRFYEREGWDPAGEEFLADGIGLVLIEYRRALTAPRT